MVRGYPFIYNKIPSEIYNVSLVFLDENYTNRPSGSGVEMITDTIRRNAQVVYLDATQQPPLEFGIEVVFETPVDIFVLTQVKDWLGGEVSFKQLQICADYFNTYYFNCYIQLEEDLIFNGGYRGVKAKVICDAPWSWQFPERLTYDLESNKSNTIYFDNLSADSEPMRPVMEFTMLDDGNLTLENLTTNRTTKFTGLSQGETIRFDSLNAIIESSMGLRRVSNFNKVFPKMIKGENKIIVTGPINKLVFIYQNAKRIGGGYY